MVDQDIFVGDRCLDPSKEVFSRNCNEGFCAFYQIRKKGTVLRRDVDINLILLCEIQGFFDFAFQISRIIRGISEIFQLCFYFCKKLFF